jgi:hypothetical protein
MAWVSRISPSAAFTASTTSWSPAIGTAVSCAPWKAQTGKRAMPSARSLAPAQQTDEMAASRSG